ncbi:methyl-accepting chemotaxis protein [Abyssisolibacter fermentans]|uniref:methyl-accepting chemotaxis protein n=1 Tax=Abyssisolibacter fermentans TaxID=1766203 RepID=UPI000832A970|nr:methyl-accepting chemotaxis protein [Abyssisolibacter fermentans]
MKIKKTMRLQISLLLSLAVIIPTIVISSLSYYISNKNQIEDFQNIMISQARNISSVITATIEYNKEVIDTLANNSSVKKVFTNLDYEESMMSYFYDVRNAHKDITTIFFGQINGVHYATVDKIPDGYDPRTRTWYKEAVANKGQVIVTIPYEDVNKKGRYVVTIAKAVVGESGKIEGAVGADITLNSLSEIVSQVKIGDNGFTTIIDEKGNVLASKNSDFIGKKASDKECVWINDIIEGNISNNEIQINNENYKINILKDEKTNYTIASFIPVDEFNSRNIRLRNSILLIIVIFLILALIAGNYFGIKISKSINNIVGIIKKLGSGDFTLKVNNRKGDVEELKIIGNSFNIMTEDIKTVIENIKDSSLKLKTSSDNMLSATQESNDATEEIAQTVQDISESALRQAQGLNITTDAMGALDKEVDTSVNKGDLILKASQNAKVAADKGIEVMKALKESYLKNTNATDRTLKEIEKLAESSNEIINITNTLSEITNQTNLLALNASIEAARAGKQGDGFAVVANEVRKLAEDSAKSADRINLVLTTMQQNITLVLEDIKESKNLNDLTEKSIEKTDSSYMNIINEIQSLTHNIEDIYSSLNEVASSKEVSVKNVLEVSDLAQVIASSTQQTSAAIEEQSASLQQIVNFADNLNLLADNLDELISKFEI